MSRKTDEIDVKLLALNNSIDAHYKWLVKMFRWLASAGAEHSDLTADNSHSLCQFGQWLNKHPAQEQEESGYLYQIDSAHVRMHRQGKVLLFAIAEKKCCEHHFNKFQDALLAFTSAVMDYKIYLLNIRSNIDVLTGLPGRRVLDETFDRQLRDATPNNLYLVLLDIDRFKYVNDTYGHLVGDIVLRNLASNLTAWTRHDETAYRYGGEEFVIIIKAPTAKQACQMALRICHLVDHTPIAWPGGELAITVTAGISQAREGEPLDVVLGRADKAMYEGKQAGRNRCMFMNEREQIARVPEGLLPSMLFAASA